jgi:hypothetical protein
LYFYNTITKDYVFLNRWHAVYHAIYDWNAKQEKRCMSESAPAPTFRRAERGLLAQSRHGSIPDIDLIARKQPYHLEHGRCDGGWDDRRVLDGQPVIRVD